MAKTEIIKTTKARNTIENIYGVAAIQWRRWSVDARWTFNQVYAEVLGYKEMFYNPALAKLIKKMGEDKAEIMAVTAWNAAFTAASVENRKHWTTKFDGPYSEKLEKRARIDALKVK